MNARLANSVDPDETARYEPSHLDLHCLQRRLYWPTWMEGLTFYNILGGRLKQSHVKTIYTEVHYSSIACLPLFGYSGQASLSKSLVRGISKLLSTKTKH